MILETGCQTARWKPLKQKRFELCSTASQNAFLRVFHVASLLEFLAIDPGRVAVELNRSIVRKQDWSSAKVEDGAEIEVVWFVGGGL